MSTLDFLNKLAANTAPAARTPSRPASNVQQQQKKTFQHGNNVMFIKGIYKGYYGFVYEFYPAKYELEMEQQQYRPVSTLPTKYRQVKVGDSIPTPTGNATVLEHVEELYSIAFNNETQGRFRPSEVARVVGFMHNGLLQVGILQQVNGDLQASIVPYNTVVSASNSLDELFQQLSRQIADGNAQNGDGIIVPLSDVQFPDRFFVTATPSVPGEQSYVGQYGKLIQVIPQQVKLSQKVRFMIDKRSISKASAGPFVVGDTVTMKKGAFKGQSATIVNVYKPELHVYIDAIGQKKRRHFVDNKERAIHSDDVFYMDLRLTDGSFAQVVDIDGDVFTVLVYNIVDDKTVLQKRMISTRDISSYQPGFTIGTSTSLKRKERDYPEQEYIADEQPVIERNDADDDDDLIMDDFEEQEMQEEEDFTMEESDFKQTFRDSERATIEARKLDARERSIQDKIKQILRFNPGYEIDMFEAIDTAKGAIDTVKQQVQSHEIFTPNFWSASDEKYIIACLVLYKMIRAMNTRESITKEQFVNRLVSGGVFSRNDINNSIFLRSGWTPTFSVDIPQLKAMVRKKSQYPLVIQIVFDNCNALLQSLYGAVNLDAKVFTPDFTKLGTIEREHPIQFMTVTEWFTTYNTDLAKVPKTVQRFLFTPAYAPLVSMFKQQLQQHIKDTGAPDTQVVFQYVLDNIERLPFALHELEGDALALETPIVKQQFEAATSVWNKLEQELYERYNTVTKEREDAATKRRQARLDKGKQREEAMARANLANGMEELDLDADTEAEQPTRRPKSELTILPGKWRAESTQGESSLSGAIKRMKFSEPKEGGGLFPTKDMVDYVQRHTQFDTKTCVFIAGVIAYVVHEFASMTVNAYYKEYFKSSSKKIITNKNIDKALDGKDLDGIRLEMTTPLEKHTEHEIVKQILTQYDLLDEASNDGISVLTGPVAVLTKNVRRKETKLQTGTVPELFKDNPHIITLMNEVDYALEGHLPQALAAGMEALAAWNYM